ncbi:MAG: TonB-dependent receptor [Bacteroidales bacterium]|nr:TonB-dependent receptor [Bacteroidales bacterium]
MFQHNHTKHVILGIVLMMATAFSAFAQRTIRGTVEDAAGPIVGATVIERGTTNGVSTDLDGKFTLTVSNNSVVEISCIGYATQTFAAANVPSTITLVEDNEFLEETVVVGYGVQKKSNVTGAIAQVKSEAIENRSNENVGSALQGKLAGVQILNTSGAPGASSSFRIRGFSSTNSSPDPLLIVDGLKVRNIDYLDPESVESIEVLKDAASAAIYGSQAGNGVVLITTKSGSEGNVRVFYNAMVTFQKPLQNIKMMNASQFKTYWQEANPNYTDDLFQNADTNWQDVVFETGIMQRHTVGFQGGNNRFSYYVDATYTDNNGLVTGDYDVNRRVSGQINVSYQVKPWLKVGTTNSIERGYTHTVSSNIGFASTGSAIGGAYYYDPTTPVFYNSDSEIPAATGLLQAEAQGFPVWRDDQGRMYGQSLLFNSNLWNPLLMRHVVTSFFFTNQPFETYRFNVNGTIYANATLFKEIVFTSRLGYRMGNTYGKGYHPTYWINPSQSMTSPVIMGTSSNNIYYQWENFANWNHTFAGKHELNVMAGMDFSQTRTESINARANGLTNTAENFRYLQYYLSTASTRVMGGSDYSRYNMSYFARAGYTYDNRYNIQASFRADAYDSSKLSKKSRWGYFPSVSAGWTISNEGFFKNNIGRNAISFLKLRASWGINGNINSLSDFQYTTAMSLSGQYNMNDTGLITNANPSTILANENLKWEETRQVDVGLDARFFNDKLTLGVDYYNKITTNMLQSITAPAVSGASTTYVNRGKVRNSGWEFDATWKQNVGKDFNYSISANLATVKNVVVESPRGPQRAMSGVACLEEGYPSWYIRGYRHKGFNDEGNAVYMTGEELGSDDGRDYLGSGIPDFTYGLTIALKYKNVDFTVFGSGVQGVSRWLGVYRDDLPMMNLPVFMYEGRWTASNKANASYPKPTVVRSTEFPNSDFFVYDASYFKLKQLQLGYTMPKKVLDALHIKGLRVYASAENLLTLTKYKGNDPESQYASYGQNLAVDRISYPSTRNFIFGLNFSF